jgi:hypothetical protein
MCWYKVQKFYNKDDNSYYDVLPYSFWGHIDCCIRWYGWKGLKRCYLSKKKATRVATKLNIEENKGD